MYVLHGTLFKGMGNTINTMGSIKETYKIQILI